MFWKLPASVARRWFLLTVCFVGLLAVSVACSRRVPAEREATVNASGQALTATDERILGFEAPVGDWTSSQAVIQESSSASSGAKALGFVLSGWTQIDSVALSSLGPITGNLFFDVLLPTASAWGEIRVELKSPAAGMNAWRDVGGVALSGIQPNSYQTVSLTLPTDVVQMLTGQYADLQIRLTINGPSTAPGQVLIDHLIFAGAGQVGDVPPAAPEAIQFTVLYPAGAARETTMFSASESLRVDERAQLSSVATRTALAAFGSGGVVVGSSVLAYGDIYAHGPITLGSQTEINGFARSESESITLQDSSTKVRGVIEPETAVPHSSYSWSVQFPAVKQALAPLYTGVVDVAPGAYDQLKVQNAEFRLTSGVYYFDDVAIEPSGLVSADTSAGPVVIYIKDSWTYRGPITTVGGREGTVLVGWLGANEVPLEVPFVGTIVAPNGKIELRRPNSGQHRGSFYGREIHVFSDCWVTPIAFDWDLLPGAPSDKDGDGVPDKQDGAPLNPDKSTRGLCGAGLSETDTDGDGTPDCIDQCPADPRNALLGSCGCVGSAVLAAAGKRCVPEALSGRPDSEGICDGAGRCESPQGTGQPTLDSHPGGEGDCVEKGHGESHYWFCSGPVGWAEAELFCNNEPGRQLVRIDDFLEGEWLRRQSTGAAWLGGHDIDGDGEWHWVSPGSRQGRGLWTGEVAGAAIQDAFTRWGPASPVSAACGALGTDGYWTSQDCASAEGFICEQPLRRRSPPPPDADRLICSIYPDACDANGEPGGGPGTSLEDCVEPADIGLPATEADYIDEYEACYDYCQSEVDTECATACQGWTDVPVDSECEAFDREQRARCKIDTKSPDFDPSDTCDTCSPGETCGVFFECAVPLANGDFPFCGNGEVCPAGTTCGAVAPYCMTAGLESPCDAKDGTACIARCFRGEACGQVGEPCAANDDERLHSMCSEGPLVCSPHTVVAVPVAAPDTNLTTTSFNPEQVFQEAPEPEAQTYESAKPSDCGGIGEPSCADVYGLGEHPWCQFGLREEDRSGGGISGLSDHDSDALEDKKGGGQTSVVSFSFDPNLDLEYDLDGFDPFSEADFGLLASTSVSAEAEFSDLLGVSGKISILDALAEVTANRCGFGGGAHLKLFGIDLLPIALCGDPLQALDQFTDSSAFSQECEAALAETRQLYGRAQKAMRDAQELVRQYKNLANTGLRFSPDLCEQVLGNIGVIPEGFGTINVHGQPVPFAGCEGVEPYQVIGMFINYYRYEIEQLVTRQQELISGHVAGALPSVSLNIPFNTGEAVSFSNVQDGVLAERPVETTYDGVELSGCGDEVAVETQQLANITFALGPIPMNLTVDALLGYGVGGALDFGLDGSAVAKVLLPDPQEGSQKHELASATLRVIPEANASVELFVGAGFDVGFAAAKIGISGQLILGELELPVDGGASLKLGAEVDTRPPPADFLGVMPSYTLLFPEALPQRLTLSAGYKFGIGAQVKNILSGTIDAKARVQFFFFSKTWSVRILEFSSGLSYTAENGGPIPLVQLEAGAEFAEADTSALAKFQVPVPFPDFAQILGLPPLPEYNPREFDGVRSLQTVEEGDFVDPRYVPFDNSRVGQLLYDGYCGEALPECALSGDECQSDDGCCGDNKCVSIPFLETSSTCAACSQSGQSCDSVDDCCNNGYQEMLCFPSATATLNFPVCQSCITSGAATVGIDSNGDGVVDGGCCEGLYYNEWLPGYAASCQECATEGDTCAPGGGCCDGHTCDETTNECERIPYVPRVR